MGGGGGGVKEIKFLNPTEKSSTLPKKFQSLLENLNPSQINLNPSRKNLNPPEKFRTPPEKISTPPKFFNDLQTVVKNPRRSVIVVYVIDYRCGTFCYGNGKSNRGTVIVVNRSNRGKNHRGRCICNIYIPRIPLLYFLLMGVVTRDLCLSFRKYRHWGYACLKGV